MSSIKQDTSGEPDLPTTYKKKFVEKFVKLFEAKVNSYEAELVGEGEKLGTTSKASAGIGAGIGGALGVLVGAPGVGSTIGGKLSNLVVSYLGKEAHKTKAGKINDFLHTHEKIKRRKMLIQSGLIIFYVYECQFTKVSWTGGRGVGMNRLAQEAVDRLINYITDLDDDLLLDFSIEFITRGIVHGKSKEYIKNIVLKNKVQFNSIECRTASIYTKVGLHVEQKSLHKYYGKNNVSNTKKYGYRLLFDWEIHNFEDTIFGWVEEDCQTDVFNYNRVPKAEELEEEAKCLLEEINEADPLLLFNNLEENIKEIREENTSTLNSVQLKLEEVHLTTISIRETLEQTKSEKKKSVWFNVSSPVKSFTGRSPELEHLHNSLQTESRRMVVSQAAAINGLGGVGKSELAKKYADVYYSEYENVVGINSETQESLKESFEKLAKELEIPLLEKVTQDRLQERSITSIVKDVYARFKDSASLLIFDNAEEYSAIKHFLPRNLPPNYKKPYILITSRNCEWDLGQDGDIKSIRLENFSSEEAESYVKTALEIETNEHDADIKKLTEMLYCFPLALHQAQAYILEKNKEFQLKYGQSFWVRDYITEYKKEQKRSEILDFSPKHANDCYVKTVFTTGIITFDSLKKRRNGNVAVLIIEILAYFASDRIPIAATFEKVFDHDTLWSGIDLLLMFSVINFDKGLASIHRLVQEVVRLQLIKQGKEIQVLEHALKLINRREYIRKDDITHFVSVWKHSIKHDVLVNEYYFSFFYGKGKSRFLHLLAESGETETIGNVLAKLKSKYSHEFREILNALDQYGRTPLYMAAENNHLDTMALLREEGAEIDNPSNISYYSLSTRKASGWTPLHVAAYNGFLDVVVYLANNGAATNAMDELQRTPIDLAVNAGHSAIVEVLNREGYEHLLQIAIKNGNLQEVEKIYRKGVDLNKRLANWTSLHMAAFKGRLDIVEFLVENGAIIDDPSDDGFTPIHGATREGHLHVLKYLISKIGYKISNIANYDGWKLLHAAAQHGRLEIVKYLIEEVKQDINMTDKKGTTPLHLAAFTGKLAVVEYLLSKNADISATDLLGTSILIYAAIDYRVDVINFLLARSHATFKQPNSKNKLCEELNLSILHVAAGYDALEIVKDLVEKYNFDVNIGQEESFTPLHAAALFDSSSVIEYLLENGANVNASVNIRNILKCFKRALNDDRVTNCSMNTIALPLESFFMYFNLASFFSFLLTASNIHRGLGYNPNLTLYKHSNMRYSFIIKFFSDFKAIHTKIKYAKSYMDEKKSNNPYSGIDSDYFITLLRKEESERKTYRLKLFVGTLIFLCSIALLSYVLYSLFVYVL